MRIEQLIGHDPDGDIRITLTHEQFEILKGMARDTMTEIDFRVGVTMSYKRYQEINTMFGVLVGYEHDEYR